MSENRFRIISTTTQTDRHNFYAKFIYKNFYGREAEPIYDMLNPDKDAKSVPFAVAQFTANLFMPSDVSESAKKFVLLLEGQGSAITQQPMKNSNQIAPSSATNTELKAMLCAEVHTIGKYNQLMYSGKKPEVDLWANSGQDCSICCGVICFAMGSNGRNQPRKPKDWHQQDYDSFAIADYIIENCGQKALFKQLIEKGRSNEKIMYIKLQATSKAHLRQGLGYLTAHKCVGIAKCRYPDIKHVMVEATGVETRKIYEKLGFKLIHHNDYNAKIGIWFEDTEYNRSAAAKHGGCSFYHLDLTIAENERIAREKAEEEARIAREKAEEERIASEKAEEEARIATEKAEEEARIARNKFEEEVRIAVEKERLKQEAIISALIATREQEEIATEESPSCLQLPPASEIQSENVEEQFENQENSNEVEPEQQQ